MEEEGIRRKNLTTPAGRVGNKSAIILASPE